MNQFKEVQVKEFQYNPFELIGNECMFISAAKKGKVNTLSASWGGFGIIWERNQEEKIIKCKNQALLWNKWMEFPILRKQS